MRTLAEKKVEEFEQVLYNYNKITPFDKLKTKLLVEAKKQFESGFSLGGEEGGLA